jgi:hypothetical protein
MASMDRRTGREKGDPAARLGWEVLDLLLTKELLDSINLDADDACENLRRMRIALLAFYRIVTILCKADR